MIQKFTQVFRSNDPKDVVDDMEEPGPFSIKYGEEVLDTENSRGTIQADVRDRENDLKELKSRIREKWQNYKHFLREARNADGIDKLEAKTKAKEAKKAARDGEQLYKLLWKELAALKNALRKDEQVKIVSGEHYRVNLSQVDTASVERMVEEHRTALRSREMKVDELQDSVDRMEDEEVEIDFSDIEKDVAELEMEDVEIMVETDDGEVEQLAEAEQEWS